MEILGVGAPELIFVIIIALIVLGPKDMQKAGKTIGRWLNQLIHSDGWKIFQKTSAEMRNLPTKLMREANLDMHTTEKDIRKAMDMQTIEKDVRKAMDMQPSQPASSRSRKPSPLNESDSSPQGEPPTVQTPEPDSDQNG